MPENLKTDYKRSINLQIYMQMSVLHFDICIENGVVNINLTVQKVRRIPCEGRFLFNDTFTKEEKFVTIYFLIIQTFASAAICSAKVAPARIVSLVVLLRQALKAFGPIWSTKA